jgi:hypothetical protein
VKKGIVALAWLVVAAGAQAQERFSLFVGSDPEDVKRMLLIAGLQDDDVLFDIGSGDGRIVIEAARMNPKLRGRGIEIDPKLAREAAAAARAEGLGDRVQFFHLDAFEADLREATVITMWLFPELMRLLRPKILAEAAPGTRVVTRTWDLGGWKPDQIDTQGMQVSLWIVPARIEGNWSWTLPLEGAALTYAALIEQQFQAAEGVARVGNRRGVLENVRIEGDLIEFTLSMTLADKLLVNHQFSGRVSGDRIVGTVTVTNEKTKQTYELPWLATRQLAPAFLVPVRSGAQPQ